MLSVDQTLVSVYFSFADKVFSLLMGKITYFSLQSRKLLFISKKEEDLERESHNQVGLSAAYGFEQEKGGYFWTCEAGRTSFIKIKYKTCFENFTIFHLGSNKSCWRQTQRIYIFRARCGNCKTSNRAVDSGLFNTTHSFPKTYTSVLPIYSMLQKKSLSFSAFLIPFETNIVHLQFFLQKWGGESWASH